MGSAKKQSKTDKIMIKCSIDNQRISFQDMREKIILKYFDLVRLIWWGWWASLGYSGLLAGAKVLKSYATNDFGLTPILQTLATYRDYTALKYNTNLINKILQVLNPLYIFIQLC